MPAKGDCGAAERLPAPPFRGREKGIVFGVDGTGHVEILPDHDARLVAEIEKAVLGIDVAAPAAGHIAIGFFHQLNGAVQMQVVAAVKRIETTVIGAFYKYRHTVDCEAESALPIRRENVGRSSSMVRMPICSTRRSTTLTGMVKQCDRSFVQRPLAISARPPECALLHREILPARGLRSPQTASEPRFLHRDRAQLRAFQILRS